MATPREALVGADQSITINGNAKASPPDRKIGSNDTVSFHNTDQNNSATVTFLAKGINEFTYQGNPVGSLSVAPNSTFGPLTPVTSNVTVDYRVTVGQSDAGAFSIEVGSGALQIDIVNVNGDTDLPSAAIPNNGTVFFNNQSGATATINFSPGDVLYDQNGNPVAQQTVNGTSQGATLTGRGNNKNVSYSIDMAMPVKQDRVETGNGSIKVGQT